MRRILRLRIGIWRRAQVLAVVLSAIVLNFSLSMAQDRGVRDSVHCRHWERPDFPPDSFGVPIYLYSDDTLTSVNLHFSYESNHVVLSSISTGSLVDDFVNSLFLAQIRPIDRTFTINWDGKGELLLAASGGTLATAYFKMADFEFCSQPMVIDTCQPLFLQSNLLAPRNGSPFVPVFDLPEYIYCKDINEELDNLNLSSPDFVVAQNYPNPFNAGTSVEVVLNVRAKLTITLCDILGRRIRELAARDVEPGTHSFSWDGKNDRGIDVASGVYFLRAETTSQQIVRKVVLLR